MIADLVRGIDSYQAGFFIGAGLFVLFTAWRGWRLGFMRQFMSILALAGAYIIGYFGGGTLGAILHKFIDYPERALAVVGAVGLGFVVYCCIALVGAILFKKTSQQSVSLVRLGYGASGAVCGALY